MKRASFRTTLYPTGYVNFKNTAKIVYSIHGYE